MVTAARPASVALLSLFAFGFADAIRTLRDGPMIDAEGREYKTAALGFDTESQISEPQFNEGSTISVQCTEVSIIIAVKADFFKNGRLLSPWDFFLREVKHSQSSQCRPVAAEDWTGETLTSVFYTGDLLHLEASYSGPDAGHRRLFIDGCVAALSPDLRSVPRYYFIENHGCFNDAKEDGSNALFNPRTRSSSLQLQLNAFLFPHDTRNSVSHFE
ncbi:hypothetical protein JOQ06_011007 [Pogonophryne albipinna]|uniref:ZP domain-containing protein n=1 Tax=Pogonophryne albipinna TaxID=1090488 RepID=A0AAD6FGA1_9TELE|nr:hypothetical protein JOQ06_011007 [Pogonophryne albipinna]